MSFLFFSINKDTIIRIMTLNQILNRVKKLGCTGLKKKHMKELIQKSLI